MDHIKAEPLPTILEEEKDQPALSVTPERLRHSSLEDEKRFEAILRGYDNELNQEAGTKKANLQYN